MKQFLLMLLCIMLCQNIANAQDSQEGTQQDITAIQETIKKYKTANEKENTALQKASDVVQAQAGIAAKQTTLDSAKSILAGAKVLLAANPTNTTAQQAVDDIEKFITTTEQELKTAKKILLGSITEAKEAIAKAEKTRKETNTDGALSPVKKVMEDNILLLTAAKFDFIGEFDVNYVGHLNIFAPRLFAARSGGDPRFGINAGIMKLNYVTNDTINGSTGREEIYNLSPLKAATDTTAQYLRQYNKYRTAINNVSWSFYVQPMFRIIGKPKEGSAIYGHFHVELVASKWTVTNIKNTLAQDTLMPGDDFTPQIIHTLRTPTEDIQVDNINRINGYFGVGLTGELEISDNGLFFLQPTVGISSGDNFVKLKNGDVPPSRVYKTGNSVKFYLVRAYYIHKIGETTLTAGTDIRGYFSYKDNDGKKVNAEAPNYAAYIGLNLKLKSIVDLFGS